MVTVHLLTRTIFSLARRHPASPAADEGGSRTRGSSVWPSWHRHRHHGRHYPRMPRPSQTDLLHRLAGGATAVDLTAPAPVLRKAGLPSRSSSKIGNVEVRRNPNPQPLNANPQLRTLNLTGELTEMETSTGEEIKFECEKQRKCFEYSFPINIYHSKKDAHVIMHVTADNILRHPTKA